MLYDLRVNVVLTTVGMCSMYVFYVHAFVFMIIDR